MIRRCVQFTSCGKWLGCLHVMKIHTNAAKILCSPFDKDLPNPKLPTPLSKGQSYDTDILLGELRKARTVEKMLHLSSSHLDVMNVKHIVTCMEGIYNLSKEENIDCQSLLDNSTFQAICTRLMKTIRLLDAEELINVYKYLSGLGIRNNTHIMQSVLKMMGGHLNDMNLGQLTFLSFLLSKQRHNSLVDGLRLALPLVLQVQIEQQLDSDNITQVVDCLQLACRSRLKPSTIQKVLTTVLEKAKTLSPTNASTVVFALLNLETPVDGYKELLNYSFEVISKNIEYMDDKQIISIIRLCCAQNFYHCRFSFAAAEKITSQKWSLENTWDAVKHFYRLNFSPPSLLDHLVTTLRMESDTFRSSPAYSPLSCVEFLTATGHRSPHVEEVCAILCSCQDKISSMKEKSPHLLVKFVSCLAILGYFPEALLSTILEENYLYTVWFKCKKIGRALDFEQNILSLVWSLEVYDQQQNFSVPSSVLQNFNQNVRERHSEHSCPLQKFIENGIGGSQFLKSGIFTRDGILIDHIVVMRSGNFPVSLQSLDSNEPLQSLVYVEDVILPADAKIVAIIVAQEDKYCQDPEVLKGWMDLKIRSLAKKKLSPVVIKYSTWKNLPDREKIPYLMHEIKNPVDLDNVTKTNSIS